MKRPKYQLTIEAEHQPGDPDGIRRIRLGLKRMLRGLGIRCVHIAEIQAGDSQEENDT